MSKILIGGLALATGLTLGTAGALAQSQGGSSDSQSSGSASSQQSAQQQGARPAAVTQDRLRQTLSQAGFQDVRIVDAAYLVQAKTKEGDTVVMMINPPEMTGSASASTSNPSTTGSTSGQSGSGQSGATRQ